MSDEGESHVVKRGGRGRGRGRGGRGRPRAEEMGEDATNVPMAPAGDEEIVLVPQPDNLESMFIELLSEGPIIQSQIPYKWRRKFPAVPLVYQNWGYAKLKDLLATFPDSISRYRSPASRDYMVASVHYQDSQPVEGVDGGIGDGAVYAPIHNALAKIVAGEDGDVSSAENFLRQEKFRFTVESLEIAFAEFLQDAGPQGYSDGQRVRGRGGKFRRGRGNARRNPGYVAGGELKDG